MDLFYTYILTDRGNNHKSELLFATQAEADASAAAGGAGLDANQGERTIPYDWHSGHIWDTTKLEWRTVTLADFSATEELRAEARKTHDILNNWRDNLDALRYWFPQADVELVHEYIVWTHHGVRGVVLSTHAEHSLRAQDRVPPEDAPWAGLRPCADRRRGG